MKVMSLAVAVSVLILAVLAVAPIFGAKIPESIWGIAIGSLSGLAGSLIPASKEKFVFEQPVTYKAKVTIESQENK